MQAEAEGDFLRGLAFGKGASGLGARNILSLSSSVVSWIRTRVMWRRRRGSSAVGAFAVPAQPMAQLQLEG
eukprot:6576335-Pyramimonas_sp.AAC.1